ncbi:DUF2778 domain-containing protein [Thaumasiovibrio sp. DFM-14]|uniref:DUF2778 domain-containing protein n=1 Tax=Thaumasiovibrio sp. DFM-14 TaxID=3384792 RepID=UPI0039A2909C
MLELKFALNGKAMSVVKVGSHAFNAFSGDDDYRNKKVAQCLVNLGPIPAGTYYIFDRQSGGRLGRLKDYFNGKDQWFALYGVDTNIDDEVMCAAISRGQFRLHPQGRLGVSKGCIVLESHKDFITLRSLLKSTSTTLIPGVGLESYGRVIVT